MRKFSPYVGMEGANHWFAITAIAALICAMAALFLAANRGPDVASTACGERDGNVITYRYDVDGVTVRIPYTLVKWAEASE